MDRVIGVLVGRGGGVYWVCVDVSSVGSLCRRVQVLRPDESLDGSDILCLERSRCSVGAILDSQSSCSNLCIDSLCLHLPDPILVPCRVACMFPAGSSDLQT